MSSVRLATEAEKRARDRLTFAAWGAKLGVDEYLAREVRLRAHAWARSAMRTWVLADGREILASLETFSARAFLDRRPIVVELLASVFTEPALRRRGYSTRLVDGLVRHLEAEARASAVILYSEIGAAQYERSGFVSVRSEEHPAPATSDAVAVDRWVREGEVRCADVVPDLPGLVVAPTGDQLDWHLERERVYRERLGRPALAAYGCAVGRARGIWAADWKADRLVVLAAIAEDGLDRVMAAAAAVAGEAGLREVSLWATDALVSQSALPTRRRDHELTMIRPLRPDCSPVLGFVQRGAWV